VKWTPDPKKLEQARKREEKRVAIANTAAERSTRPITSDPYPPMVEFLDSLATLTKKDWIAICDRFMAEPVATRRAIYKVDDVTSSLMLGRLIPKEQVQVLFKTDLALREKAFGALKIPAEPYPGAGKQGLEGLAKHVANNVWQILHAFDWILADKATLTAARRLAAPLRGYAVLPPELS
jgi:hypothetical protein